MKAGSRRKPTGNKRQVSPAKKNVKPVKVEFQTAAEPGSTVLLSGSFTDWESHPLVLKHRGEGVYAAVVSLPPGRYEYKFKVNGAWRNDDNCTKCTANAFGTLNSVIDIV